MRRRLLLSLSPLLLLTFFLYRSSFIYLLAQKPEFRPVVQKSTYNLSLLVPQVQVDYVDCAKVFNDDGREIFRATKTHGKSPRIADRDYIRQTKDCKQFISDRRYITEVLSEEEEDFPLAFSLLMFKDVEQVERLLRAIYRPNNFYCIHIDKKATASVKDAMYGIINCFPNVFTSGREVDVNRYYFSVLEPEIDCMRALWEKSGTWLYFINLTGQEFPLKTNLEIVRILQAYNGANDSPAETSILERRFLDRGGGWVAAPPIGVRIMKGPVHVAVTRGFVDFVLHNSTAQNFLEWTKLTKTADETFFASLNHSPWLGIPGTPTGDLYWEDASQTRFKVWSFEHKSRCHGKWVHLICIFGIADLPMLARRREMFANKFHLDYQPAVLDCLEELHFNRTRDDLLHPRPFYRQFYERLSFARNHL